MYKRQDLASYDLTKLGKALNAKRDLQFGYLGLQTLYDRYFLHIRGTRIELPQVFFMRVAMGLALRETDREARAIEFLSLIHIWCTLMPAPRSTPWYFSGSSLVTTMRATFSPRSCWQICGTEIGPSTGWPPVMATASLNRIL